MGKIEREIIRPCNVFFLFFHPFFFVEFIESQKKAAAGKKY